MDWGAWWATVHGVARSWRRLRDFTFTFHLHALEKEMATHFSVLAWRIPGMAKPGGLPSMGSHRVGHDWSDLVVVDIVYLLSHVWHFVTARTKAHQAPLSMGFPRQENRSGLPFPTPGDLSNSGIKPASPTLKSGFFTIEPPEKPFYGLPHLFV